MRVHLVDGTWELFRYHFALPSHTDADGREVAAVRGVLGSLIGLLEGGATHVGVATDRVIESFRNRLHPGYKTGEGIEPALLEQFPRLEEALEEAGFQVWGMVEYEADDALASAASVAQADPRVEEVWICTPDKDLAQCVQGTRVVQRDRRRGLTLDARVVEEKFGVPPASIPDYLALVGDSADGFPGLPGWGAKSAARVLARYGRLEDVPASADDWDVAVRGAARLAETLVTRRQEALLYRRLATLVRDVPVGRVDAWRWRGPRPGFAALCEALAAPRLVARAARLAPATA